MIASKDGKRAVIADPDRDRVITVDLDTNQVIGEVALPSSEPGRLVEDGAGRVHVALRRGNELVAIDVATGQLAFRRAACVEPRGVAWDAASDSIHVACASGDLATFAASGGEATRLIRLERDLRDVVVVGTQLVVSRFRDAELITLDAAGAVVARSLPPTVRRIGFGPFGEPAPSTDGKVDAIPAVAWRTIALPNGTVVVSHQRQVKRGLETEQPGGYGGSCTGEGPVEAAITTMTPGQPARAGHAMVHGALPIDIALSPTGDAFAIVLAGTKSVHLARASAPMEEDEDPCEGGPDDTQLTAPISDQLGTPTSVAWRPDSSLLIYYPELPALSIHKNGKATTVRLTGEVGYDSGRAMFHMQTGSGLACASCHPEGREDGRVWEFARIGTRRTQSLGGGILSRAPYHWAGDMTDLPKLMNDVFGNRMAGGTPSRSQTARPAQQLVLDVANALPDARFIEDAPYDRLVGFPINIFAEYQDPDDSPERVTLVWKAFSPSLTEFTLTELTNVTQPTDERLRLAGQQLVPTVAGTWTIQVTATDSVGDDRTVMHETIVVPDAPPCIVQLSPVAPESPNVFPLTEPTLFQVPLVSDALDRYPVPPGDPLLGETRFSWSIKRGSGAREVQSGATGNSIAVDPATYSLGEQIEVRVEVFDRNNNPIVCADADPTCSIVATSCIQRQTWLVEAR